MEPSMPEGDNILFLVEGKKTEKKYLEKYFKVVNHPGDYVFTLEMNVYMFYEKLIKIGIENTTTIDILKEMYVGDKEKSAALERNYPYIFLVFDLDVHAPISSKDDKESMANIQEHISIIKRLASVFNSAAGDFGQLLIDYPMCEAYRDFAYNKSSLKNNIEIKLCNSADYKDIVDKRGNCKDINDYSKNDFDLVTKVNVRRLNYLISGNLETMKYYTFINEVESSKILKLEEKQMSKGSIVCLACISFFPIVLYGKEEYNCIVKISENYKED